MGVQLKVDGKTKGPFSESEILEMVESGSVKPTDLAREKGKIKWKLLKEVGKRAALVVKVADHKEVLADKGDLKAAGRRVAKADRKAGVLQILSVAFRGKASHNPDKDST